MFFTLVILKLNIERETLLVQVLKLEATQGTLESMTFSRENGKRSDKGVLICRELHESSDRLY